jgi:YD repeat-containing protein
MRMTALIFALIIAAVFPAQAAQKPISLKYDVYAGGFKALDAQMQLNQDDKAYDVALKAQTQGFIGSLFPWQATYTTQGKAGKDGQPVPTLSLAESTWKDGTKLTEMSYDPNGRPLKATTKDGNTTNVKRDIDQSLSADAVDMLTSTVMMMQSAKNKNTCAGTYGVFDGKRRFNIKLKDEGQDNISKSDYSSFSGTALKCTITVEPVAGFSKKDKKRGWMAVQAHTEKYKKEPAIWFGKVGGKGPYVPVRLEIASDYGTVVAHLSKASDVN